MARDQKDKPDLDAAYALETPDDNRQLYGKWAETYDQSFAQQMDYQLPAHVARVFAELGGVGPVLDVGAGTGLLAEALRPISDVKIDALDLSADMLAVAGRKGIYRDLIVGDLTKALPIEAGQYGGVVSSGTFTHGHVGPEVLDQLLTFASTGALFVLSVNAEHFEARGFEAKFKALGDKIDDFHIRTVSIYGAGTDEAHSKDKGHLAVFRRM
ncbi:class I SAM-dependent DNA methyltransferase [Litoreibacter janthinus]|uniref:Methyltransferase domain-containing protein n=1 Tax=Litoreibacter janthinus TaxID=670154 RepID=A0A1I6HPE9_9RHOB|nr:methyltransferase domain-containing protein [Litoreibacter janthinus]SFR56329.1 Methyltransferase domain-containing protein [Litoreibacter janthinus]